MYDVAIIGAGVVGALTARLLSRYDLKLCILEKCGDVAMGTSKANSAIVHAGFDAPEGSMKAKLNVRGSEMMEQIAGELGVKYRRNGSLVIARSEAEMAQVRILCDRGTANGVRDLRVIGPEELRELEPNISKNALGALYAPTGAIICPYDLTIAAVGNAMDNGADLKLDFAVTAIDREAGFFRIHAPAGTVEARYVVNAAGLYADAIAAMVGDNSFHIHPRRGEYVLLDRECGGHVSRTIFQPPTKAGKGILVTPTVDGNLLLGPTSEDRTDKEDKDTTAEGLAAVQRLAAESVEALPRNKIITSFCGLRAVGDTGDFIIRPACPGFVSAAGIESPGLSAAPAIAEELAALLEKEGLVLTEKADFDPIRPSSHHFREASMEEKNAIIVKDPAYGRIVCRCETVTEGEIIAAIRTNPGARDLDGVKRRTRAQMGRCQGGFCGPAIVEILARELGIPFEAVTKCGGGSYINIGKTKEVGIHD